MGTFGSPTGHRKREEKLDESEKGRNNGSAHFGAGIYGDCVTAGSEGKDGAVEGLQPS